MLENASRKVRKQCDGCGALQFMIVDGALEIKCQRCGKIVRYWISDLVRDGLTTLAACQRDLVEAEQESLVRGVGI